MKIVTAVEMREIDRVTSEHFGVPSLTLMENAGTAVAEFAVSHYTSVERIGVICGKGNNGGDGFVAARKLHGAGKGVRIILLAEPSQLRGDAAEMFGRLPIAPVIVRSSEQLKAERERVHELARIDAALAALGSSLKRTVTAASRRKMAAAQKARWAKVRRER